MKYYVVANGKQNGPLTEEEVLSSIESNEFSLQNSSWHDGLVDWVELGTLQSITSKLSKKNNYKEELSKEKINFTIPYLSMKDIESELDIKFPSQLSIITPETVMLNFNKKILFTRVHKNEKSFFVIITVNIVNDSIHESIFFSEIDDTRKFFQTQLMGVFDEEFFNELILSTILGQPYLPIEITNRWTNKKVNNNKIPQIGETINAQKIGRKIRLNIDDQVISIPNDCFKLLKIVDERSK